MSSRDTPAKVACRSPKPILFALAHNMPKPNYDAASIYAWCGFRDPFFYSGEPTTYGFRFLRVVSGQQACVVRGFPFFEFCKRASMDRIGGVFEI